MRKVIVIAAIFAVLMVALLPSISLALTTQDITVTCTPEFVGISNAPGNWDAGVQAASATPVTGQAYFTVTNTSNVNIDVSIKVTAATWVGGVAWTHSDTATPGADTVGLKASQDTGLYDIVVKFAAPFNNLVANQVALTDFDWELKLLCPTSFTDGIEKSNTVRLTATKA